MFFFFFIMISATKTTPNPHTPPFYKQGEKKLKKKID